MNPDQQLIATMGVVLMLLAVWLVYKPYLSDILFNNGQGTGTPAVRTNNKYQS